MAKSGLNIHGTFIMNIPQVRAKLDGITEKAQFYLDAMIERDMSPFTPWKTGDMEGSIRGVGTGRMFYDSVYARRNYYGETFNWGKVPHPLAGAKWFERAKSARKVEWNVKTQRFISKGGIL